MEHASMNKNKYFVPFSVQVYGRAEIEASEGADLKEIHDMADRKIKSMSGDEIMSSIGCVLQVTANVDRYGFVLDSNGNELHLSEDQMKQLMQLGIVLEHKRYAGHEHVSDSRIAGMKDRIKKKLITDKRIGRKSLEAFLEILNEELR